MFECFFSRPFSLFVGYNIPYCSLLMRVTRAFIQYFRTEKIPGHIVQVSSMGGRLAFPLFSIYHATKWAVEGFTESLQYEVEPLGIKLKLVEPGAIKTEFYGTSRQFVKASDTNVYDEFVEKSEKVNLESGAKGDAPAKVAAAIFKAAQDNSRKMRYPVGNPAPMLLRLRKMLGDQLWFTIVRSSYKL
jgi:short-subunit dehydrogenase